MKKWYVYKIVNSNNQIEYIGETIRPEKRFYNHTHGGGLFNNRTDVKMEIIKEFDNKRDAYFYQSELQTKYGLESDLEKHSKGGILGRNLTKKAILCIDAFSNTLVKKYDALTDAANELNISVATIHKCCNTKNKEYKGYKFEYIN
jgi:predicted GIY-YIG superfamily endonuclease